MSQMTPQTSGLGYLGVAVGITEGDSFGGHGGGARRIAVYSEYVPRFRPVSGTYASSALEIEDGETEARRLSSLSKITELARNRTGV